MTTGLAVVNYSSPLEIAAPAGARIRFTDGQLYSAVNSAGNVEDNITLVGESASVWRVIYAGQAGESVWMPSQPRPFSTCFRARA